MTPRLVIAVLLLAACVDRKKNLPPPSRFYFPSGIHHVKSSGTEGVLYVVSANFDRRYDNGLFTAVDLDTVGLPTLGAPVDATGPKRILDLMTDGGTSI